MTSTAPATQSSTQTPTQTPTQTQTQEEPAKEEYSKLQPHRPPPNLLETSPTFLAKKGCHERTTELLLSMMTTGDDDNDVFDYQNVKNNVDEEVLDVDDDDDDDPLMNKYVATPRTPTGRDTTSSSLFFSITTSPITTTTTTTATCGKSMSPLVSPTTIETHKTPVLRLDNVIGSNDRKDHYTTSPSSARHPVPFSPSMLLNRYEQHIRRRRVSLEEMRRNPSSLFASRLAGSKLVITGQTKASAKESSSTTLDGDHVPLRKRVRLEESVQSKNGPPSTETKATSSLDMTGGCQLHHRFVTNNVGYQPRSHHQCHRGEKSDQNHHDHHHRPLLQSSRPPSFPVQHHNSPVSEFLRRQHPPSSSNPTVSNHQTGSASDSELDVNTDVYPTVEGVMPSPPRTERSAAMKTNQRQGAAAVVVPPIPSFQTNSRFPLPRATNSK